MATKYGKTWWGEQWLGSLQHIDYSNRLPRGASYARKGMVREINFNGNVITAKVQGSCRTPYKETIILPQFSKKDVDKLIDLIENQPVVLSKLLNRQLDESLATMAEQAGMPLFPKKWSDWKMECSCPDWAVPCKHLAAVIYKTSMEIDNNPFLIFSLHGLDLMEELKIRGTVPLTVDMVEVENCDTIFDGPLAVNTETPPPPIDYTTLKDLTLPLSSLLPESPAFCHNGDFKSVYQKELTFVAKTAGKVLQGKKLLVFAEGIGLDRRDEYSVNDYQPWFYQKLLEIDADTLHQFHPSVITAQRIVLTALQLIAHGCIVPQIFYRKEIVEGKGRKKSVEKKNYSIIWQPALLDSATRSIINKMEQQPQLWAKVITEIVHHLAYESDANVLSDMFFRGREYDFSEIGENSIPGGIRSWLDRYFLQNKYQVTFQIEEVDDSFSVDVLVNKKPLKKVMTASEFASQKMEILKQLSILCDIVNGLGNYINNQAKKSIVFSLQEFTDFLIQVIPTMQLLGVNILLPKSLQQIIKPQVSVRLKAKSQESDGFLSMGDLLSFDWRVAVGDEMLTPEEFTELMGHADGLLRFKERYVYIDRASVEKLQKALTAPPKLKPGELLQTALSGEYMGAKIEMTEDLAELIKKFTTFDTVPLPAGLAAQLRPYQERGFSWMYRNMKIGFGSIIADDMGLGKTLQVITLILKLKEEGGLNKKRVLVVVPTGLLHNWEAEVARFAPQLSTAIYHGNSRSLSDQASKAADIILTTYGVVRSDFAELKKGKWQLVVIDEAQNIKNSDTAQSKAVHSIPADVHIAMSGTPVENRLSEFWSIIDFTNKGYLGSLKDFVQNYATPIQKNGDLKVIERFRKISAPFMLRRLKTDKSIISDLPDKIERDEFAPLTTLQTALYQETLNRCMAIIEGLEGDDSQTLFKRQGLILQMILALKQICNHPTQYLKDDKKDASLSGKTEMLLDLLRSIVATDEKVLVFTQFREMGELLQHFIREELGEDALFYHGGCTLKQRQQMVEQFQRDRNSRIFILSLKAAGTGLNLTSASHVIHYDLWWNPAVEAQATDRAYRIGQHKNVQVHRFITQHTFEEKINAMIQDKKHLADLTVSTGESWIGKLTNQELRELFG